MHFPNSSSSPDVYGTFSSAEQAEYDLMRDARLDTVFDPVGSLEFGAFGVHPPLEKFELDGTLGCGGRDQQNDLFPTPFFDSPFSTSSPSSLSQFQSPSTVSPRDIQLSIPESGDYSAMSYLSPFSAFDLSSPFSCPSAPSPVTPDKSEGSPNDSGGNALGLFGNPHPFDAAAQSPSLSTLFSDFSMSVGAEEQFAPTPRLTLDEHSFLSPIVDGTAQLFLGTGLPSPLEDYVDLSQASLPTLPSECAARSERSCSADVPSPGPFSCSPERLYPSPLPTPERPVMPLPPRSARKSKASRGRPVRAAAARRKAYRESSASPVPGLLSSPSFTSPATPAYRSEDAEVATPGEGSADACEYGVRVWGTDNRGRRVAKWKCQICGTITGRRPDLHRHYKTCVTREKFFCVDVVHADGSLWPGCGMMFSRRDACHRHLKKRFTEGRCSRTKPKLSHCLCEDEYEAKLTAYHNMLANAKWRAALPAAEKNRLVKTALSHIKQDMF